MGVLNLKYEDSNGKARLNVSNTQGMLQRWRDHRIAGESTMTHLLLIVVAPSSSNDPRSIASGWTLLPSGDAVMHVIPPRQTALTPTPSESPVDEEYDGRGGVTEAEGGCHGDHDEDCAVAGKEEQAAANADDCFGMGDRDESLSAAANLHSRAASPKREGEGGFEAAAGDHGREVALDLSVIWPTSREQVRNSNLPKAIPVRISITSLYPDDIRRLLYISFLLSFHRSRVGSRRCSNLASMS